MNINWKHAAGSILIFGAGLDSYLASTAGAGAAQAMHISSWALGLAGTVILLLQSSIAGSPSTPTAKQ